MSNFSILTNSGAYVALANLSGIQSSLGQVQKRVSTGLQVADATDNAAVFAVAQGIRANLQQYNAVNTGLNDAAGIVQTALAGVTSISNLLPQIISTLTQLADNAISDQQRQTYTANLKNQVDEVQTYINSAIYNGQNLIAAQQGNAGLNFGYYTAPSNVQVNLDPAGDIFNVSAFNLTGGTNGVDGWLGLARLVYFVNGDATATNNAFYGYGDYYQNNYFAYSSVAYIAAGSAGSPISRPSLSAQAANAALALHFTDANAQFSYQVFGITYNKPVVFGAAVALFSNQVNTALGILASTVNNIQLQLTFNQSIADSLTTGLGNLVDANLAQASAKLTALQTQQQLATQSLSIANSQPNTILSLFK